MPRRPRVYFPGAIYHAYDRGVDGQAIFVDDHDRIAFLSMMRDMERAHSVRVIAYCLMGNHFHFAIQVGPVPLSVVMQRFLTRYCTWFNQRHDRKGHLFGGRYQAILCADERYLAGLIRYIHMNPVRAGLVVSPGDWPWSSYVPGGTIGTETVDFDPWPKASREVDMMRQEAKEIDLDSIGASVAARSAISLERLRSKLRGRALVAVRRLFVKDAIRNGHTLVAAARWLVITPRSAGRYVSDNNVTLSGPDP